MQKVVPHLWFDKEAKEAAEFYVSIFPNSKINSASVMHNTPSGDVDTVSFNVWGQDIAAISAGPLFKLNPSISFIVGCDSEEQVNSLWEKLVDGGTVLMELGEYPFSKRYGWVEDKYGVSWQLILVSPEGDERPRIVPSLLFVGENYGKAEEARRFYLDVFKDSKEGAMAKYGPGQEPNKEGTVMFADFKLGNLWLAIMDGALEHNFNFNEAFSFMVYCKDQEEIDYFWEKLSAVPEAEQCGWIKDKYGASWQIIPEALDEMLANGTEEQVARITEAFLQMKKFNISELEKAYKE